ncbi:DEAD/DEAH box helicase [Methylobacter sp. S3L5C]|uniref:DEAD/DEAH box helicase n=1 Tax=Methylobacter sp. S3L5C TaxID=2839024 RepID=UPI001FACE223|nr:DEAD/DEAH box helicase [Methylobacter sp. S3L5C]UOA07426.1 DEAD/DEAH box helicase [Methylobacter sp. S3L5C]
MNVIHGAWIPKDTQDFMQVGDFYLWVESDEVGGTANLTLHPQHLPQKLCLEFLKNELALGLVDAGQGALISLQLPTFAGKPLPSPELQYSEVDDTVTLQSWQVYAYPLSAPLKAINNIHFLCCFQVSNSRIGSDFLFWYYFSQSLKQILAKDQYIPLLLSKKSGAKIELYRRWQLVSSNYESLIQTAITQMPLACSQQHQPESLLRHFAEVVIDELLTIAALEMPQIFTKKIQGDFLETILLHKHSAELIAIRPEIPDDFIYWQQWQQKLLGTQALSTLHMGFQLLEADATAIDQWRLVFFLSSLNDPSLKLDLADFWADKDHFHELLQQQFGLAIEQQILINLAQAARIYPKCWQGMEGAEPDSVQLTMNEAFEFLKESAWILEDAGFKIIIPAWLTPKGRRRAKVRLRSGGKVKSAPASGQAYFSMETLTDYHYELAIGDETLTPEEWQQLIDAKAPLIYFRGQWMELDRDNMQDMLAFIQQQNMSVPELSVQELLKKLAEDADSFELDVHDSLAQMLAKLSDNSQLELIDNPAGLNAELRDYQKRGVAWLRYLENLGLNGCLADDMGLGKTMQVISLLVMEREQTKPGPTLLIAPTSVIGNWQKEIEKFAPQLTTLIHHGSDREQAVDAFKQRCLQHDLMITSYTLARKDSKLLGALHWHRVVLDEAQNIKNPKSAQTKAILKLNGDTRLALTGTPVENRLMDLWSIFNFLNPGYLGKQTHFRKSYELPVQRDNDQRQSAILKRLIQPFILRRLKTDKAIIKDLPDKIDNKIYCNLSKEQASLYEVVVQDVVTQLEAAEGIQRQGLMLSTLMKLKQICNHPMQFLQDGSAFTPERSHKLERISEMLEEAMAQGDSVLVFTQFTEIGENLSRYLAKEKHYKTHYLHGGTPRNKRELMISDFQDPDTSPAVFILSLKAGGVGITLTQANHVFHFDRWWNPAVENQATDRAFRIGQKKNVFVHKFVTLGTLEERIDQMISDKQKMADSIVGNDESWLTKLDNQAFKELIALNKHSIMED